MQQQRVPNFFQPTTVTQGSQSQTGSPPKKKLCPEGKDDPLNEDDDEWCDKFKEADGGASAHVEGSDSVRNIENHD